MSIPFVVSLIRLTSSCILRSPSPPPRLLGSNAPARITLFDTLSAIRVAVRIRPSRSETVDFVFAKVGVALGVSTLD